MISVNLPVLAYQAVRSTPDCCKINAAWIMPNMFNLFFLRFCKTHRMVIVIILLSSLISHPGMYFLLVLWPTVPIREMPKYSNRRKIGSMSSSMRSLMRSRSDPRLHASVLEEQMLLAATSHQNLTTLGDFYDTASYPSYASNISSHGYSSDSPCSLSISSASSGPRKFQ